ncbi:MAG TPA: prepilin-type N-terminal cleavage/methylation domain-containing protein [Candidatus Omnitrophota bacterium]|nr:prepilin-type N-terminal cleavage/methylation domain-containing protein [Candidatus Omnitrophota bacterium]HPS36927.1 prepilin-type N-terminal cleavage/methylation domain-containing protein [Candidatus Omnitrophota bacterium]
MKMRESGFTLVEVMIAVAISSIIIAGVFGILIVSNRSLEAAHIKMNLEEGPREALFKIAQEIRQTAWHKIDTLAEADDKGVERADTIKFVVPVPAPDAASLVDASFTPKWACNIQYLRDTGTNQIIRISEDLTTLEKKRAILCNNITSLGFSRTLDSPGLITITAQAQKTLADGRLIPETPLTITVQAEARNP